MTKGNLNNLDKSFVQNLSNNWALVTSGASDNYNMMTVNWGGIGFLWNKPVLLSLYGLNVILLNLLRSMIIFLCLF